MMMRHFSPLVGFVAATIAISACTEPHAAGPATSTPSPALEARLELSDSAPRAGDTLAVRVRLHGSLATKIVSFTGRVAYDSTALRYVADVPSADGATRVTNPVPGLIRSAGVSAGGFGGGVLVEYRFVVVDPSGVGHLVLGIDEMHDASHVDASHTVVVARLPGSAVP